MWVFHLRIHLVVETILGLKVLYFGICCILIHFGMNEIEGKFVLVQRNFQREWILEMRMVVFCCSQSCDLEYLRFFFIYLKFYVYRDSCLWGIVEDKILRSTHIIRIMFLMIIFVPSNSYQLQWYNWKRWYMRQIHTTRASGMRSLNEDLFGCSVSFLCFLSSGQKDSIVFFVVFLDEC